MSKSKLSREPRKARTGAGACGAWWYENEKSIDVVVNLYPGRSVGMATITRHQIESWLKKLDAK